MTVAKKSSEMPYKRIVLKFGTSLLTGGTSRLKQDRIQDLVRQVAQLHKRGIEPVVVSSGAIAAGRERLGLTRKIKGIPYRQVLASVGQGRLMNIYERLFDEYGISVAQALLTREDIADRAGYLNARNTLMALLELRVVCIVNENDVVSTDEIKEAKFGDNDNLSAMLANLVDADLLIILSDIGGLYSTDPNRDPRAELIPLVKRIDTKIRRLASVNTSVLGTGGMITKIEAASLATSSGVTVVIADGREPDIIMRLTEGVDIGTRFLPTTSKLESRKRWMLSGLCTKGKLIIDNGAAAALRDHNRSLLSAGIHAIEGKYERGEIVAIYDTEGNHLGCGITNYNSSDTGIIKGAQSNKIAGLLDFDYGPEVVHRNNLALLESEETSEHRQTVRVP
jgi:glutamate 5-kinase